MTRPVPMSWAAHPIARPFARLGALLGALLISSPVPAQPRPHEHGVVSVDVAVQGATLSVQLEAPLDSLLGFEHRPRTDAQRQAAAALKVQLNDGAALFKPAAAAQCTLARTELDTAALDPLPPGARPQAHADVDARYEFTCAAPARLATLELVLLDRFPRIARVQVQVAGPAGQLQQTLRRPARQVQLVR